MKWEETFDENMVLMKRTEYNGRTFILRKRNVSMFDCYVVWRTPLGKFKSELQVSNEIIEEPKFFDYAIETADRQYNRFVEKQKAASINL